MSSRPPADNNVCADKVFFMRVRQAGAPMLVRIFIIASKPKSRVHHLAGDKLASSLRRLQQRLCAYHHENRHKRRYMAACGMMSSHAFFMVAQAQ